MLFHRITVIIYLSLQTNARISTYADPASKPWNITAKGATIQTTVDFLMATDPSVKNEEDTKFEIYPHIAAVASVYGDPDGKYGKFLNGSGFAYADDATFLWDQPLSGGHASKTLSSGGKDAGKDGKGGKSGALSISVERACFVPVVFLALVFQFWQW